MYADYQEFATAFARQCRERRNAENEAQREVDELTKPATVPSAADVRKSGAGAGLVFKTRNDARVADDDDSGASVEHTLPARRASAKSGSETAWWEWTDQRIEHRLAAFGKEVSEAVGEALGRKCRDVRDQLEEGDAAIRRELELSKREILALLREQVAECGRDVRKEVRAICERLEQGDAAIRRELELSKRELTLLQKEIGLERGLRALHDEVATARLEIPNLPAIEARLSAEQKHLEAEQARLESALAKVKDQLGKARVDQSIMSYELAELRKQAEVSGEASIEMEFESRHSHFQMKAAHPEAAKALKEFAAQIVNGQDGTIWLPGSAGKA
jgi:chromosome segregation ATPase